MIKIRVINENNLCSTLPVVNKKSLLRAVLQCIKCSNVLPAEGDDYDYYASFQGFRDIMDVEGKRILHMIQDIMKHQHVKGNMMANTGSMTEIEDKFDFIMDANDQLLEKIGNLLDEASGVKKAETSLVITNFTPKHSNTASWNKKNPPSSGGSSNNYRLLAARQICRPQSKFSDDIDNRNRPFVPNIRRKPNALKLLEESLQISANAEELENPEFIYPHPYAHELEHFQMVPHQLEKCEPQEPASIENTPFTFVDTSDQLKNLCQQLAEQEIIAVDLEAHSYRSFQGLTCLMQISTRKQDYIIDTLELRKQIELLNDIFTDPKIVKVFHGANCDIDWLQRDFGVYVVNMFDTGQAARVLNFSRFSLSYLMARYCKREVDKQYQLADWRIRPLPDVLVNYAREDTHYLLYIYDQMKNELLEKGNAQKNLLISTLNRSRDVCLRVYQKPVFTQESYLELYHKSRKTFNSQQLLALKLLYAWRDRTARNEDESTGYVLPNHMLLQITEILPRERQGVLACCNPIPPLVRQHLQEIHILVKQARESPLVKVLIPTEKKEAAPSVQDPKYDANSLMECPHDLSKMASNESDCMTEPEPLRASAVTENSVMTLKKKPSLAVFGWPLETAKTKACELAETIKNSFQNPFTMFFPVDEENQNNGDLSSFTPWKLVKKDKVKRVSTICVAAPDSETMRAATHKRFKSSEEEEEESNEVIPLSFQPSVTKKKKTENTGEENENWNERGIFATTKGKLPKGKKIEMVEISDSDNSDVEIIEALSTEKKNKQISENFKPYDYSQANFQMFEAGSAPTKSFKNKFKKHDKKYPKGKFFKNQGKKDKPFAD